LLNLYPNVPASEVPYGRFENQTFPGYGLQWRRLASIYGDVAYIAPCRLFTKVAAFYGRQKVFRYRFNTTDPQFPLVYGSTHASDIGFVWSNPSLKNDPTRAPIVDFMSRAWISFIADLTPNHHGLERFPTWHPYTASPFGQNFVIAQDGFKTEDDIYRRKELEFITDAILRLKYD
jgi:acetylcholinesterase